MFALSKKKILKKILKKCLFLRHNVPLKVVKHKSRAGIIIISAVLTSQLRFTNISKQMSD
jgi:hypothetical protein